MAVFSSLTHNFGLISSFSWSPDHPYKSLHPNSKQDFEAVVKLASVTELLIGEGQQTPVSIAFFTYSCA